MRRIRVNVQNIMTNVINSKRNDVNIMMIKNVFTKKKMKRFETNIDIGNDSWRVVTVCRKSCKHNPIGVVTSIHKRFTLAIRRAWSFSYFGPRWFLDKYYVKLRKCFKYSVCDEGVLANVL